MNGLLIAAAVLGVGTALVESQRRTNKEASARFWRRQYEIEHQVTESQIRRIERLELALGQRTPEHWLPRRFRPPARVSGPTPKELAVFFATTDGMPIHTLGHGRTATAEERERFADHYGLPEAVGT